MKIPAGPKDLNADWLTSALRDGGAINRATVTSFESGPLEETEGLYAQIVRVSLEYDLHEAGAPQSLIAKFSSATPELRKRAVFSYEREIRFYKQLAHQIDLPTPACYYADIDIETGAHIILLEDLAPARSGSRVAGCSPEQAELAVHRLAEFHAYWWENPQLEGLDWLKDWTVNADPDALRNEYDSWWPKFFQKTKHFLPDPIKEIGERFGLERANIERYLFSTPPQTLVHGDYHLGNLVFGTPEGGVPFAVVDWQLIRFGRGARDMAYFLSENLLTEDRRAIEMDLLRAYHQILVDNGVRGYTFEQCLHDYKLSLLQRFCALVSTIAIMPFTEEQLQIHIDILLPRNIAAILDHNAGELLL